MSIFTLLGQGLKLDTRADIEPHLATLDSEKLEEIHLGGNTLGVEACEALGELLAKCTNIKVRTSIHTNDIARNLTTTIFNSLSYVAPLTLFRSQTSQTFSPVV